jgi:prepilin-type N-terminal cleavage/methylation domain-containing protein
MRYAMVAKKEQGVTLIELLIVMVIAAFLVAGIYSLFITQQRSYSVQDQVAGVQQDARVAVDIMARDIRMAGLWTGAGSGTGFFGVGAINGLYNYAVDPVNGGTSASDQITVVLGAEQVATVTAVSGQTVSLSGGVGGTGGLAGGDYVAFEGEKQVYQIQSTDADTNQITVNGNPPNNLDDFGAQAYRVRAITYSVTALDGNPGVGALRRNDGSGAQPFAGDGITTFVEDLQFAYQVAGDTANWWNTPAAAGTTNDNIRMVRINLVVRTAVPDSQDTSFSRPKCEDHVASATKDGFRRRVYTTVVKVRNL